MTVRELMDLLSEADPDAEVRYMAQPSWPFEYSIGAELFYPETMEDDGDGFVPDEAAGPVVYLVEGRQLAYGTRDAWR